ncbi:tail completion protein gp17 [Sphingomonas sp. Tas61C01]|uniref:tail completion protein gp17 n=1 Tax=Sphingomonas sp. Tas61C01 TaxID=3458297 RepID=UPI00403E4DDE
MSAGAWLQTAIVRQLKTRAGLDGCAVFDMPPTRAALPHAVVEEPILATWDAATITGREGRVTIVVRDGGERPSRLRRLQGQVEDLIATMPADLGGEGWRVARLRLLRSRIVRGKPEQWIATSEYEVRVYRANG